MVLTTMIARVGDGLPLAASVSDDEDGKLEYQNQAKLLFKKLNQNSPPRCSIETGPYFFHYIIENNVCYLVLCAQSYPKRLAFSYLEDLHNEFQSQYGEKVATVNRPYFFIEFDNYIQKTKKSYTDARARRNLSHLNVELQDVQRIMIQNIDDVLQRGAALSELDNKASNLSILSQKYKKESHYLNLKSTYAKVAAVGVIVFVCFLYFWVL
ncbi:vesicle-trafficking protein SEC22b [Centruroides vittatus]|uniref:vesicle-trafficking protein SEC22b-like n=1 Tax=Centruroides sculpturatus TaxID=218467 RepID=UPI000C6C8EA3|nr:vesicle-trafficking protein SEC22b-like [Centruroides sculpturatus]